MRNISTELNRIMEQLASATDFTALHSSTELNYFLFELRKTGYPLLVYNFRQPALLYLSEQVLHWLGETQLYSLNKLLHRSGCSKEVGEYILHFDTQPHNDLCSNLPLLKTDGSPLLLYGCSRCIAFDEEGKARIIITLLCPVDYVYGLSLENGTAANPAITDDMRQRFDSLTEREKEILNLMVNDKTDVEIASSIDRSTDTVRTHRRNILKKLGLNTASGLAKYGVFF